MKICQENPDLFKIENNIRHIIERLKYVYIVGSDKNHHKQYKVRALFHYLGSAFSIIL
jgi:hypothetical protein